MEKINEMRQDNELHAATINAAWGVKVAWVEERKFKGRQLPVVVSQLVGGLLPGRKYVPAFFPGLAPSRGKR